MHGSRQDWFPTPIWHFKLEDFQSVNQMLLSAIDEERKRDCKGEQWSNVLGWHSIDTLHQRDSFQQFINIVQANVMEATSFLKWDLNQFKISITTCWAMVNGKFAFNSVHNHPNSILSGVYYVQVPENCGGVFFSDPRPASQMLVPPVVEFSPWTFPRVTYKAYEGSMLLFPSWLLHGVEPNLSDEDRVSISFNIGMIPIRQNTV